jgi:hypothetical protein
VANWRAGNGNRAPEITVELPEGPGSDMLFENLATELGNIGITLQRAKQGERGQLVLLDRVARFAGARWFLNQFNCGLRRGVCSRAADKLVAETVTLDDPAERAALLAEAEAELTELNGFIPFGQPVRWSLVRAGINGFAANQWVFHPLPQLAAFPR